MNKKKLYIMCGPAGSGKSTWIRCNAEAGTSAHISRDRIRFNMIQPDDYYFAHEDEVYAEYCNQIVQALDSPWVREVYADATHLTSAARERVVRAASAAKSKFDVIAVIIRPSLQQCLDQNALRSGRERVPEKVICNMYHSFSNPLCDKIEYKEIIYEGDKEILWEG